MEQITKEKSKELEKIKINCPGEVHKWVLIKGTYFVICGKCGINKTWFDQHIG